LPDKFGTKYESVVLSGEVVELFDYPGKQGGSDFKSGWIIHPDSGIMQHSCGSYRFQFGFDIY
jgi:hypothetical protein